VAMPQVWTKSRYYERAGVSKKCREGLGSGRRQALVIAAWVVTLYSFLMARPLRIEYSGALYHAISRGNGRGAIVLDKRDREKRLDWLPRPVETYG